MCGHCGFDVVVIGDVFDGDGGSWLLVMVVFGCCLGVSDGGSWLWVLVVLVVLGCRCCWRCCWFLVVGVFDSGSLLWVLVVLGCRCW